MLGTSWQSRAVLVNKAIHNTVRERAAGRCEYCHLRQADDPFFRFAVDHIIAEQHGGPTVLSNLALSCFRCNLHKGPNIAGRDRRTGKLVPLFHPRRHKWSRHFAWNGPYLVGRTAIGRVTIVVLAINHLDAVALRESLILAGDFAAD